jgi:ribose transport system permease protein
MSSATDTDTKGHPIQAGAPERSKAHQAALGVLNRIAVFGRGGGIAVGLLVLVTVFSILSSTFLTVGNIENIALQASVNAVLAIGMTMVIVTAGIDLSVGSTLAVAGVVAADLMTRGVPTVVAVVGCLAAGLVCGGINGLLIERGRLAPFIVTLGTLSVYRGLALLWTDGQPIFGLSNTFRDAVAGDFLGIPIPVLIAAAVAVVAHMILRHTRFGEYALALGGNREAARLSGINIGAVNVGVYALSGMLAGVAAIILIARLGAAEPIAGTSYELYAIAAAVMGGASLMGGRGSIVGAVLGALVISTLQTGLTILNVQAFWQLVAIGTVVILAVAGDRAERSRAR